MKTKTESALLQTYWDVEALVHSVTHAFLRQKHMCESEYEEWYGEACMAFTTAHRSFDLGRGTRFTTWLWHCIWNALSDKYRREAQHWATVHLDDRMANGIVDKRSPPGGRSIDFCLLSQDAKVVVEIILGTFGHVDEKEANPGEIRLALYALLSSMGWSGRRIVESFHEMRVALTE